MEYDISIIVINHKYSYIEHNTASQVNLFWFNFSKKIFCILQTFITNINTFD